MSFDRETSSVIEAALPADAGTSESTMLRPAYIRPASGDARLRLVFFHHAGGNGASYRAWAPLFPQSWEIVFVEYAGRGLNAALPLERELLRIATQVSQMLAALPPLPAAWFGHSMGSLVAYECARQAQQQGRELPRWLGVSGRHAPHRAGARWWLHELPDDVLIDAVLRLGGTAAPQFAEPALRAEALRLLRGDLAACERYRVDARLRLAVPMSAYIGREDDSVPATDAQAWSDLTAADFRLRRFGGGHFYLSARRREVAYCVIQDVLDACAQADAAPSPPPSASRMSA